MREMLIQGLFSDFARSSDEECTGQLKSALIAAFETAIDQGLPPQNAIATVLEWVSEECARLNAGIKSY
jgi:hypothetical protein